MLYPPSLHRAGQTRPCIVPEFKPIAAGHDLGETCAYRESLFNINITNSSLQNAHVHSSERCVATTSFNRSVLSFSIECVCHTVLNPDVGASNRSRYGRWRLELRSPFCLVADQALYRA